MGSIKLKNQAKAGQAAIKVAVRKENAEDGEEVPTKVDAKDPGALTYIFWAAFGDKVRAKRNAK
eukprot:467754-Pyramimonas_sp.AAC.2